MTDYVAALHGFLYRFDYTVSRWVNMLPAWLRPIMLMATFVGQPVVVIGVSALVVGLAFFRGARRIVLAELCGLVAFGLNTLLKHLVHRTRPDTLYALHMRIKSYSFPSGHAFGSMFFYGLLAYLAFTRLGHPWNWVVALLLVLLILFVGVSRVYLGAHFPSDVVVGWLFGGICLALVIALLHP